MSNIGILSFNSGELSPLIDARSDVEKHGGGCRHLQNMIPTIYGPAVRRPGTYYITPSYITSQTVRMIPFVYSSTIAYELEFGDLYIRAFYNDAVIQTVSSPYAAADLFQLQYKQIGDTIWIVHPSYAQRKLTRTSATSFSLDVIEFNKGPFLLRNDLVDPDISDTATMSCAVTDVGDSGTLTCSNPVFDGDHVDAIFKLVHPRVNTTVSQSGAGNSTALDVKGTFSFNTHGTWTGTVVLQRRENSSTSTDWEDYRTYKSSDDRNVQLSAIEDADNVEYRIEAQSGMSAAFSADITVNNSIQTGIVRIDSVTNIKSAEVTVLTELASTNATKRWAEGAWSDYRGYPSSITFMHDRCIYGGSTLASLRQGLQGNWSAATEFEDDYTAIYDVYCDVLANGNFVIVWEETGGTDNGMFAVYDTSGAEIVAPADFHAAATRDPDVIALSDGTFFIIFQDDADGNKGKFVIYNSAGVEQKSETEFDANDSTNMTGCRVGDDNVFAIWRHTDRDIYYAIFDSDGAEVVSATNLVGYDFDSDADDRPAVIRNADGNACFIWPNFATNEMYFSVRNSAGTEITAPTKIASVATFYIDACLLDNGNIFITYTLAGGAAYFQIREADGTSVVNQTEIVSGIDDLTISCATLNNSNVLLTWDDDSDFYSAIYTEDGALNTSAQSMEEEGVGSKMVTSGAYTLLTSTGGGQEESGGEFFIYSRGTMLGSIAVEERRVWFGETGDYDNFEEGVNDADSFSLSIPTTNEIRWVESLEALFIGTAGDEWIIRSNDLDTPLTPTNFTVRQQSNYGSRDIQPVKVNEQILFVDFVGRKERELTFLDTVQKFVAPDLTALAEHITYSGIVCIAHQRNPDSILWCVLDDGSLISMTYEREQNVVAWADHPIAGTVQSVCITPSADEDRISLSVLRDETVTYGGETVTYEDVTVTYGIVYIEKMMPRIFGADLTDAFFVDSGITVTNTPAATTITGLTRLIGKTVTVLGDGAVYTPTAIVDDNGEVEISTAVSKAQVGLPFTYKLEPMRPDVAGAGGTTHGSIVKVPEMGISFLNTMNAKYGVDDDTLYDVDWTNARWTNNTEITGLFTGDVVVVVDGGFTMENNLIISGDDPLPVTVRALIPKLEVTGR